MARQTTRRQVPKEASSDRLLEYLEFRAVEHAGQVSSHMLEPGDRHLLEDWNRSGFVRSGHVVQARDPSEGDLWVMLSDLAWERAAVLRRKKAERGWAEREFQTASALNTGPRK